MAVRAVTRQRPTDVQLAAQPINLRRLGDQSYLSAVLPGYLHAHEGPWRWYERLGEIHYSISRSARIAGFAGLKAVAFGKDGKIETELESGPAADLVQGLVSPYGGVRGLIERYYTLMKVPGDSYLIRVGSGADFDGYMFLSPSEVKPVDDSGLPGVNIGAAKKVRWVKLPIGASNNPVEISEPISRDNFLGRTWAPSHRFVDKADSPLMALDTECELLFTSTMALKAKMKSRLQLAGLLYIPSEIQMVASGEHLTADPDALLKTLVEILTANVSAPDSAAAIAPILLRGPGQFGEMIKFIQMERDIVETEVALRAELIERILFGLDIQKQATEGEHNSRFSAWASSDDERRVAVLPDLEAMCWALNRLVLHPFLKKQKWDDERILRTSVWYELDRATVRANRQEDAKQALDRALIGSKSGRRDLSYGDTDAPEDDDEYTRMVGIAAKEPYLALWGLDVHQRITDAGGWEIIGKKPGPSPEPAESKAGPGEGPEPGSPESAEEKS